MKQIKVAVYSTEILPGIHPIGADLPALQAVVGGYIEQLRLHEGLYVICNEEGQLHSLPVRHMALMQWGVWQPIAGNFFVCRVAGSELASLRDSDRELLAKYIHPV